jgi:hypothetical protein
LVVPNRPETGDLSLRVREHTDRSLASGSSLRVSCLPEAMLVEAVDLRGRVATWLAPAFKICQYSGLHTSTATPSPSPISGRP